MFAGYVSGVDGLIARVEDDAVGGIHLAHGRAIGVMKFMRPDVADIRRGENRRKSHRQCNDHYNCDENFFQGKSIL